MLRLAKWPPVRIQHEMAAMLSLNKVALNEKLGYLHDTLSHHMRFPNGQKVLDLNFKVREKNFLEDVLSEDWIPVLGMNAEDRRLMGKMGHKTFPLCSKNWFNELPSFIKYKFGTKAFETAVHGWYHVQCWCRAAKDCSRCKKRDVLKLLNEKDVMNTLEEMLNEENTTIEEWTKLASEEIETFHMNMMIENELEDTFEGWNREDFN